MEPSSTHKTVTVFRLVLPAYFLFNHLCYHHRITRLFMSVSLLSMQNKLEVHLCLPNPVDSCSRCPRQWHLLLASLSCKRARSLRTKHIMTIERSLCPTVAASFCSRCSIDYTEASVLSVMTREKEWREKV